MEAIVYRPFTTLSYLFNYAILDDGPDPAGYHWVNFFLHAGNVVLAYAVVLRMLKSMRLALAASALWAVHPVLTESVTNIVGRADLLAGTAILGGFLLYLLGIQTEGWRRWAAFLGMAALTAAGVFAKESAVVLAGVLIGYELTWWTGRRSLQRLSIALVFVLIPCGCMLIRRATVLAASDPGAFSFLDNPLLEGGFWQARLTAATIIPRYLALLVWPAVLSCDYSYPQIRLATGSLSNWSLGMLVIFCLAGVILLYRRNKPAFFFAVFGVVTFLPSSNLVLIIGSVMAERFLYLPALGFAVCLALAIDWLAARVRMPALVPVVSLVIVLLFGARTWARNRDWQTDLTLAESAARASPQSFKTHKMLADALEQNDVTDQNLDRAIVESDRSAALLAGVPDRLNNWQVYSQAAGYHLRKGDLMASQRMNARSEWERASILLLRSIGIGRVWLDPEDPDGTRMPSEIIGERYRTLSVVYSRLSAAEQAYQAVLQAQKFDPLNPVIALRHGEALLSLGRISDAAKVLMEARMYSPDGNLDAAIRALYTSHPECFDLASRCAALENARRAAKTMGRRLQVVDDSANKCKALVDH